jgi:hypothetical protein
MNTAKGEEVCVASISAPVARCGSSNSTFVQKAAMAARSQI